MDRYNLVVLPVRPGPDGSPLLIFSAGCRGVPRRTSVPLSVQEVRAALGSLGITLWQTEELLRGNKMAVAPRSKALLTFTAEQLDLIRLIAVEEEVPA